MSQTVVSHRFSRMHADEHLREVVTPEGVPIMLRVARFGDRAAALFIDGLRITLVLVLLGLMLFALPNEFGFSVFLVALFFLRNGYFMWYECRTGGRTPGKRRIGLQVVDANGGVLETEALIVRNLTREVEWFVPIAVLSRPELLIDSGPTWLRLVALLWVAGFVLIPVLNRERRRVGDLLAGTMVVREPKARLLADLTSTESAGVEVRFTPEQLAKYGVYELQVLEELLRDRKVNFDSFALVAEKIRRKIGWQGAEIQPEAFLRAFYEAQRTRLEHDLLLGRARERKES